MFEQLTSSVGQSAAFLARLGYSQDDIRRALVTRFAVAPALADAIAEEAIRNACSEA